MIDPSYAVEAARGRGWEFKGQKGVVLLFERPDDAGELDLLRFWYTTGTVGTTLTHPRTARREQLFRQDVNTWPELERIMDNPRVHTGKGYYTKVGKRRLRGERKARDVLRWEKMDSKGNLTKVCDDVVRWEFVLRNLDLDSCVHPHGSSMLNVTEQTFRYNKGLMMDFVKLLTSTFCKAGGGMKVGGDDALSIMLPVLLEAHRNYNGIEDEWRSALEDRIDNGYTVPARADQFLSDHVNDLDELAGILDSMSPPLAEFLLEWYGDKKHLHDDDTGVEVFQRRMSDAPFDEDIRGLMSDYARAAYPNENYSDEWAYYGSF